MTKEPFTLKITPFFRINILFFPILTASIFGGYLPAFTLSYICAILHEATHIAAAHCLGIGISYMEILPFGVCARLKNSIIKNPVHEIIISLSGPCFNIAAALIIHFISLAYSLSNELVTYFFYCNMAMALINFIPALPLDGGRCLKAYITIKTGAVYAYKTTVKVSRIFIFILLLLAAELLLTRRFNFSFILIGSFLLGNLCIEQKNISKLTMYEMLHYDTKLKNSDMTRTTVITAVGATPARKILKYLSYNNYNIIHVVDDNLGVIKTLTEGQLVNALTQRGIRITLNDI